MKSLLKYITLLLVGGVIIPFCSHFITTKQHPPALKKTRTANRVVTFSFINDVAGKIWPALKLFQ